MTMNTLLYSLKGKLSDDAQILQNSSDTAFKESLQRWSNLGLQVPAAIIKPATELDAVTIVKAAYDSKVPFVLVSGGHSPWSTTGANGFVLDLTLYKSIAVNSADRSVIVAGGVLTKELSTRLSDAGQCTALGNGNTVGVIPFCLGGGISILTSLIGFGCDNIVSARIITPEGNLKEINANRDPDLFWAVKGAGQFFGVVIEITLRTYPLSIFGTPEGKHWFGTYLYPVERAEVVCKALEPIMLDSKNITIGHLMVMAPPPDFKPLIGVTPHFIGDPLQAPAAFKSLMDLEPVYYKAETPSFPNLSDHLEFSCTKGDFKRFSLAGLTGFEADKFLKVIDIYLGLLKTCPDAGASGYFIEWHSPASKIPVPQHDSAFSHYDVYIWLNCLSWYRDEASGDKVAAAEQKATAVMRADQVPASYIDYPNVNRDSPLERRYRGFERLEKLRKLKKELDPRGILTTQLL